MTEQSKVDRVARDALAEVVLATLCGALDAPQDQQVAWDNSALDQTDDITVRELADPLSMVCDAFINCPSATGPETRWWLLRVVAVLRSDLEVRCVESSHWHPKQWVGIGGILLILGGAAATIVTGACWPLVACWAVAGTAALFYSRLREYDFAAEVKEMGKWAPFRSEAQWRQYEHLVAEDIRLAEAAQGESTREDEQPPHVSLSWLLFGPLYGTLYLPSLLKCEHTQIHLVVDEDALRTS